MRDRFKAWLRAFLIAQDQLWGVRISFFTFVMLNRGKVWNPDETISSKVGRHAVQGKLWALCLERIINRIMRPFDGPDHCRRSIEVFF